MVTRHSMWDDYARAEAIASVADVGLRCTTCGMRDSVIPLKESTRHVTWANGDVYEVFHVRCQACGARDITSRDWAKEHENDQAQTGSYMEADGRQIQVRLFKRGGVR